MSRHNKKGEDSETNYMLETCYEQDVRKRKISWAQVPELFKRVMISLTEVSMQDFRLSLAKRFLAEVQHSLLSHFSLLPFFRFTRLLTRIEDECMAVLLIDGIEDHLQDAI